MGGRHRRAGLRDRRADRHQGRRRHGRGDLRGAMEEVRGLARDGLSKSLERTCGKHWPGARVGANLQVERLTTRLRRVGPT